MYKHFQQKNKIKEMRKKDKKTIMHSLERKKETIKNANNIKLKVFY
jgi:hypothetical protein